MKTQKQIYYEESKKIADTNKLFLSLVADGLTRPELKNNIEKRPELWGKYHNWLDNLPESTGLK